MIRGKKNWKARFFYLLFFLFTLVVSIIIYKEMDFPYAYSIVIAYAAYLILILVYFILVILWKARYLNKNDWLKRLWSFIAYFSLFLTVSLIIDMIVKNDPIDFYSLIPIPFGLALGFSFSDLIFKKFEKKDG